jgi:hypothetical protein
MCICIYEALVYTCFVKTSVQIILIYAPNPFFLNNNFCIFFFEGDFENSKGQTRGKQRHVGRDV